MYLTFLTHLCIDVVLLTTCMMGFISGIEVSWFLPAILLSFPTCVSISETLGSYHGVASRYPPGFYAHAYVAHMDTYECISYLLVLHVCVHVHGMCDMLIIFLLTSLVVVLTYFTLAIIKSWYNEFTDLTPQSQWLLPHQQLLICLQLLTCHGDF